MSEYKYTYRFSEQTIDTRYYKVESNTKLTQSEMQELAWSVKQTEGETFTCNEGRATFEGTEYGDEMNEVWEHFNMTVRDDDDRIVLKFVRYESRDFYRK